MSTAYRVVRRPWSTEARRPRSRRSSRRIIDSIAIEPATASGGVAIARTAGLEPRERWSRTGRRRSAPSPSGNPSSCRSRADTPTRQGTSSPPTCRGSTSRRDQAPRLCSDLVDLAAVPPSPLAGSNEPWIVYGLVFDTDLDGVADVRLGMDLMSPPSPPGTPPEPDLHIWRTDLHTGTTGVRGRQRPCTESAVRLRDTPRRAAG